MRIKREWLWAALGAGAAVLGQGVAFMASPARCASCIVDTCNFPEDCIEHCTCRGAGNGVPGQCVFVGPDEAPPLLPDGPSEPIDPKAPERFPKGPPFFPGPSVPMPRSPAPGAPEDPATDPNSIT